MDNYKSIIQYGSLTTEVYKEEVPENAPWGMNGLWRYEYVGKDACALIYTFNYYKAFYDVAPPIFQNFPNDTVVATLADVPPVDTEVKIIDVCQYVVWDTVMTLPVLDVCNEDTLGFIRRWMAREPSGHESFRDQMIWLGSGDRKQYSMITGRIADEDAGTRTQVSFWNTGNYLGEQGIYYFVPEHSWRYQVKIDSMICSVDTLKFDKELWSDTLEVEAGESLDQGWIIRQECVDSDPKVSDEEEVVDGGPTLDPASQNIIQSEKE